MAAAETIEVEVIYCPRPGAVDLSTLRLPRGSTLQQALQASGVLARHVFDGGQPACGVWGRVRPADSVLRDRDRVEVYRGLTVDPKEARRLRYKRQRDKTTARAPR